MGTADSSALVKIGNTSVICGIKLEVGTPEAVLPKDGRIEVAIHATPLSSPAHELSFKASDQAVSLGQYLSHMITSAQVIHLADLSITEGKSAWVVYADVMVLDDDGNLTDAAMLSVVQALRNVKLPATRVDDATGEVFVDPEGEPKPLLVRHTPVSLTFAIVDQFVLADPTSMEEEQSSGMFTLAYNEKGQLCSFRKPGGADLSVAKLTECQGLAKKRVSEVLAQLPAAAKKA